MLGGDVFVQPTLVLRGTQYHGVSGGGGLELGLVPGDKRRKGEDIDFAVFGGAQVLNDALRFSVGPGLALLDGSGSALSVSAQYSPTIPFDGGPVAHSVSIGFSMAWDFK